MTIKAILDNLDGIAEPMHALYQKGEDGKFYLDLDKDTLKGHPSTAGLSNAHNKTKKELEVLQEYAKNFEGIPLEQMPKIKEMLGKMADEERAALIKTGNFDEYAQNKVKPWREKVAVLESENKELRQKNDENSLNSFFRENLGSQTLDTAFQDVYFRLKSLFKVDGGQVKPVDETQAQDAIGYLANQVKNLEKSAPHLFPRSEGPDLPKPNQVTPQPEGLTPAQKMNRERGVY